MDKPPPDSFARRLGACHLDSTAATNGSASGGATLAEFEAPCARPRGITPREIFDEIAGMIASPHMFATTPPTTLDTGLIPLQPDVGGPSVCAVGNELASYLRDEQPQ
jgi:hypothetical protein